MFEHQLPRDLLQLPRLKDLKNSWLRFRAAQTPVAHRSEHMSCEMVPLIFVFFHLFYTTVQQTRTSLVEFFWGWIKGQSFFMHLRPRKTVKVWLGKPAMHTSPRPTSRPIANEKQKWYTGILSSVPGKHLLDVFWYHLTTCFNNPQ